ncbi:hypothetical protein AWRI1631_152230 [Saccharomyces cerevisiae AWRI1631]|uniref:Uncharacterized protein n=1 Tax=Saccharomyces cerevisiae (strain AWRI1631) TaxID=545124 RepID=B5VRW1_YEAS6|nr:hypothetical protein AWRI1631_152230 [Saccharomyces cerevisiae AWRI1631]
MFTSPVNLFRDGTTVQLDFSQVSLLLSQWSLSDLSVDQNSDDGSVLLDSSQFSFNTSTILSVLGRVFGESLLLRLVPVLVESSLDFVRQMFSPDGGQRSQTSWGFDVTDNTNNDNWWSVNNGDSFDNFTLVELRTWSVQISDNGGHTSLVTQEGS